MASKGYSLIKRDGKKGRTYYYRLAGEKTMRSTGKSTKAEADQYVREEVVPRRNGRGHDTLREYAEPFYIYDECPHCQRLIAEGKSVTRNHANVQRSVMRNHVFPDPIVNMRIAEIRRADLLDYRARLLKKHGQSRTVQKAMSVAKTILKEAYFREDIDRDPSIGIGKTKYTPQEVGILSPKELAALFAEIPGPWGDVYTYTAFCLSATCGLRRGEVLALVWRQIDFDTRTISVDQAMKSHDGDIGLPKWEKVRRTFLAEAAQRALHELRRRSHWIKPGDFVLAWDHDDPTSLNRYKAGDPRLGTWWTKRFRAAMVAAGFMPRDPKTKKVLNLRSLKPHGLRHSVATHLRDAGEDPERLRASFGWADDRMLEHYVHWQREHFEGQRSAIDEMFSR